MGERAVSEIVAPDSPAAYDSVGYQQALSQTVASVKSIIQRRQLDPLRYLIEIDAGLPVFAARDTHQLRIAYNRFDTLFTEIAVPHSWMLDQTGKGHEDFLIAVDDMVLALKGKVQQAGRPL